MAIGALVERHVLNHAQRRDVELLIHADRALAVGERHLLRGGHHNGAGRRHGLAQRQRHIAGAGWHIDDQVVEVLPTHVAAELLDGAVQHGTAPDHRRVFLSQKPHRDNLDAVLFGRTDHLAVHLQLRLQAEHDRHVGPVDVAVEHADARAQLRQRHRQVHGHGRLADAALAGAHRDHVLHTREGRLAMFGGRGRANRERHGHINGGDAWHGRHGGQRGLADPLAGHGRRTRQFHGKGGAAVGHCHVLDELERHDVRAQVGVEHAPQRRQDQVRGHKKFSLPRGRNW